MFRPGPLDASEADRLNALTRKVEALDGLWAAAPMSVTRGPDGRLGLVLPALVKVELGVLDGDLEDGGTATVSVWRYDPNEEEEVDTLEDIEDVRGWMLAGGTVAAGSEVVVVRIGDQWYVIAAEC